MSLVKEQSLFLLDVSDLIREAHRQGFEVTGGELYRTAEQQAIYVREGKSKTSNSPHLRRLAIDLHFFRGGRLVEERLALKPLGDFWESLSTKNRWGGSWRGLIESGQSSFVDTPHFERRV